jgi:hypothetical protein
VIGDTPASIATSASVTLPVERADDSADLLSWLVCRHVDTIDAEMIAIYTTARHSPAAIVRLLAIRGQRRLLCP